MRYFIIFICNALLSLCTAQINTESMRNDDNKIGIYNNLSFDFTYFSGQTNILQINTSYRLDYLTQSNVYGFISGHYNRAFEKNKEDFSNRGFIHFRVAKTLLNNIDFESFLQKETNQFINLQNRELLGSGLRVNQINNLFIGLGAMLEIEKYNNNEIQRFIKSTNYINYKINIFNEINLQNVIYYQFRIVDPLNYRILWDGSLTFEASEKVSFQINTFYRYDINGESYFEISNGISCKF